MVQRKWYCIFLMNGFHVVVLLASAPVVHVTQGLLIRHEKSSTKGLDYLNHRYDLLRVYFCGIWSFKFAVVSFLVHKDWELARRLGHKGLLSLNSTYLMNDATTTAFGAGCWLGVVDGLDGTKRGYQGRCLDELVF
nr:hypothetical protein [Tanacetum cinerariifolium]